LFLAAVAYQYVVREMLPPTSVISEAGAYVMIAFFVIVALVLENSVASFLGDVAGFRLDVATTTLLGKSTEVQPGRSRGKSLRKPKNI
jgi:hypothetical protein